MAEMCAGLRLVDIEVIDHWLDGANKRLPLRANLVLINADKASRLIVGVAKKMAAQDKVQYAYVTSHLESTIKKLQEQNILRRRLSDEYYEEYDQSKIKKKDNEVPTTDAPPAIVGRPFSTVILKTQNPAVKTAPASSMDGPVKENFSVILRDGRVLLIDRSHAPPSINRPIVVNGLMHYSAEEAASVVGCSERHLARSIRNGLKELNGYKCHFPAFEEAKLQFTACIERHKAFTPKPKPLPALAPPLTTKKPVAVVSASTPSKPKTEKRSLFKFTAMDNGLVIIEPLSKKSLVFDSIDEVPAGLLELCD